MPYDQNNSLPKGVSDNLPDHAQDIWREAYNSALEQYKNPEARDNPEEDVESVAAQVAWAAVKKKYHKDESDQWVEGGEDDNN